MINPQLINTILPMLQQNPSAVASQYGKTIPQNQQFDGPKGISEYLLNSGQIEQNDLNQAIAIARQMGYKV